MMKSLKAKYNHCGGFTLVELVVVIAILGILVAIAVPQFESTFHKQQLESAADQIVANLNYARAMAVYTGKEHKVIIETTNDGMQCYVVPEGASKKEIIKLDGLITSYGAFADNEDITTYRSISEGRMVTYTASGSPGGIPEQATHLSYTNGQVWEKRTIGLEGKSGQIVMLKIKPVTGRVWRSEIQ